MKAKLMSVLLISLMLTTALFASQRVVVGEVFTETW